MSFLLYLQNFLNIPELQNLLFLLEDINESRDQLAIANEKLQESNNELEAFTYSVSHDLKAPLRAIDGFSKFLLEDYSEKLDSEGVRLLNVIRDNTKKMDTLILDLLNLSRIGKTELNLHEINMSQFVKNIVPEPWVPEIGGSSPKCGLKLEIVNCAVDRQIPFCPIILFTPHR